jgi:aminoglycoside phosphotransferase (APT) family kinase protein
MEIIPRDTLGAYFHAPGRLTASPVGSGHIHQTFLLEDTAAGNLYILRQINNYVFPDVDLLMKNLQKVTAHLKEKKIVTVTPLKTLQGQPFYKSRNGKFWHLTEYFKDSRTYNLVHNDKTARSAGAAFGEFIAALADLDTEEIGETIPEFHNLKLRLETFDKALKTDTAGRVKKCSPETAFTRSVREEILKLQELKEMGLLPLRLTHNDTKLSNILFDADDNAISVIDLDTVMPGLVHYDFGDAVRTFACTAPEDEKNLSAVSFDKKIFSAFTTGFVSSVKNILSAKEKDTLYLGPFYMTFIMGIRFLTDFLKGDVYFHVDYPEHNLQRARVQFRYLEKLEENKEFIRETIRSLSG